MYVNRRSKYQLLQHVSFWRRWSKDYLSYLQKRHKWTLHQRTLRVDTLVVVKDDNLPPYQSTTGRITDIYPESDGVFQVVNMNTVRGILNAFYDLSLTPFTDSFTVPLSSKRVNKAVPWMVYTSFLGHLSRWFWSASKYHSFVSPRLK